MKEKGRRFDTAEIGLAKHSRAQRRRERRQKREFPIKGVPAWAYKIIFILFLCVAGMLFWFNRQNLAPANVLEWVQDRVVGMGIGDGYPAKFDGVIRADNFTSVNREAVMVTDTSLLILNSSAKQVVTRQHSFTTPVMKASGTRTLIYNLGGTGYQLESYGKTLQKGNTSQNLLGGDLAANGSYALLTQEEGYCGKLTAYKPDGKVKFYYLFSEYYPTSVALNTDGTKAVITAISAKDGGMVSAVYVLDFQNASAVKPVGVYMENMMTQAYFCENGTAVAVGDRLLSIVNTNTRKTTDYSYNGMKFTACAVNNNGRTVLSLAPYEGAPSSTLVFLDSMGKASASVQVPGSARSVSIYGGVAGVLAGSKLYAYDAVTGQKSGEASAGEDARAAVLSSESKAYILGVSEVRQVNIH